MKKFLIAGSSLAAVAAAGSAGAVDVTLGGSIEMGIEYGVGKKVDGFMFDGSKAYQSVSLNISAAGTTDAGMKFGGKFAMSTADELKPNPYLAKDVNGNGAFDDGDEKQLFKLVNTKNTAAIKAAAYNVSGGQKIDAKSIVSVKINSEWHAADDKVTKYHSKLIDIAEDSAICKIAGKVSGAQMASSQFKVLGAADALRDAFVTDTVEISATAQSHIQDAFTVVRDNTKGTKITDMAELPANHEDGYLPVGRLLGVGAASADIDGNDAASEVQENFALTLGTSNAQSNKIHVLLKDDDALPIKGGTDTDKFWVALNDADTDDSGAGVIKAAASEAVDDAQVWAGPFMSVKMTSSTTKMVVGAVCVTNDVKASSTKAYLDLASKVMHVGAASIFVEGGFGRLSLQQGDYSGKVAAIGSAGDQATLTSTGLVAILEGTSMMGMAGYAAVDVGSVKMGQRPNYLLGTSVDLMGLTVAVEMEDEFKDGDDNTTGTQNIYIDNWDMGTTYTLGDMDINGVLDSAGDRALSTSAEVGGFKAAVVMENVKKGNNKKAGLSIDTTLSTTFNGMAVSIGLDEDMDYSLSGSYSIGNSGLAISASYDSGDQGGKVSAKLSF